MEDILIPYQKKAAALLESQDSVCVCSKCFTLMKKFKGNGKKWTWGKEVRGESLDKCVCCDVEGKMKLFTYL